MDIKNPLSDGVNFFQIRHNIVMDKKSESRNPFATSEKFRRATSPYKLDGFDSNILEERAYLNIQDETLKLEYQINQLEEDLMIINDEILAAVSLDDSQRATFLKTKKQRLESELEMLNEKYFDIGALSKVAGFFSSVFRKKSTSKKSKMGYFFSKYILANISKRLKFTFNLREALQKLSNINKSVDELISMRIPFGELTNRYEKLSDYINKANDIHSNISKNVNEFENIKPIEKTGKLLDIKQ